MPLIPAIFLTITTLCFGSWLAASYYAWLSIGVFVVFAMAIALSRVSVLFVMPFAICVNLICFSCFYILGEFEEFYVAAMTAIATFLSTICFAVIRTIARVKRRTIFHGIVFETVLNSMLGGLLVALMLVIPLSIANMTIESRVPFGLMIYDRSLLQVIPFGLLLGLVIGIPLGFICDIFVGLRTKKALI